MRHPGRNRAGVVCAEGLESRQLFAFATAPVYPIVAIGPMPAAYKASVVASAPATPSPSPTATPTPTPTSPTPTPTSTPTPTDPAPVEPPPVAPTATVIRIDAGRGPHTELNGRSWGRDEGFIGGNVSIAPYDVANTFEDPLYYTRRWGNFEYSLSVPSGSYDVRLHFADPVYTKGGQRQFNVYAEGKLVLNRFDVAGAGGGQSVLVRSLIVNVADGMLDLRFRGVRENAILSAIEIVPRSSPGWTAMSPSPQPTSQAQAAAVNGKLYVFGGFAGDGVRATRASNVYDPDADSWTKRADLPRAITGAGVAADGNTVWLAGGIVDDAPGKPATTDVWKYDVVKDTWTAGPALPEAMAGAAMVRFGRKLRIFGGVSANGADSAKHFVYDMSKPQLGWRASAPLPVARHHLGAVALGNKIYAIGGQQGANPAAGHLADVHVYNWETNSWSVAPSLPFGRSHIGSSTLVGPGNRILVAGGVFNGTQQPNYSMGVAEYDPVKETWSNRVSMPGLRSSAVARFLANRLIVTGGDMGQYALFASTWTHLLQPATTK
jgi:N-acetylneuraminic acid mutarotase